MTSPFEQAILAAVGDREPEETHLPQETGASQSDPDGDLIEHLLDGSSRRP